MADPSPVSGQITDSVTQANVKVLGDAPSVALGNLYQVAAQSIGLAMQNAVSAQQQLNVLAQAATTMGVAKILGDDDEVGTVELGDLFAAPMDDEDDD